MILVMKENHHITLKTFSLAVNIIISYSNKPLKFMTFTGLSFSFISILFIIYNVYLKYTNQNS